MQSKLTLSIKSDIIEQAKEYAQKHGRSLSNIVEEYLKSLEPRKYGMIERQFDPLVEELAGSVRYKTKKSDDELLQEAKIKKHL